MLLEIICNKFKQKKIVFHQGLNTILGDENASNSIGKTTMMLIIDYVFGGSSFAKSEDVLNEMGHIDIHFKFCFSNENYYFIRKTSEPNTVYNCDNLFNPISQQSVKEYCNFLKGKYAIDLYDISFREVVSLYSRIYGKGANDEKEPLKNAKGETNKEVGINRLLKLLNFYRSISEFYNNKEDKKKKLSAYKKAQSYSFVAKITKTKYNQNSKYIEELEKQMKQLSTLLSSGNLDLTTEQLEELSSLKEELLLLRKIKNKNIIVSKRIKDNRLHKNTVSELETLKIFFPNINTKKINEINHFHNKIADILSHEIESKLIDANKIINTTNQGIETITDKINTIIRENDPSKIAIDRLLQLKKEIDRLILENKAYKDLKVYEEDKKQTSQLYEELKTRQTTCLQQTLNNAMEEINDYIYNKAKKPPMISFNGNSYLFYTPNDTGTGTSHKGMIVFDLSILELTKLPILIHDSIILKQISDDAIDKIMEKYASFTSKQIFIALDKKGSYHQRTQEILSITTVLKLSSNGNELFGRSWNTK